MRKTDLFPENDSLGCELREPERPIDAPYAVDIPAVPTALGALDAASRAEFWAALALSHTDGLGARSRKRLLDAFGSAFEAVRRANDWCEAGLREAPLREFRSENWREPAARMVTSLRGLDRVLVAAHVNPDGDALGSMSALGWLLKDMGKEFVLYSPSGVPDYLSFLPLPCTLLTSLERLPFEPQALGLLDCGEPHRLGDDLAAALEGRFAGTAIVNIDHHLGSDGMGTVDNWIEPAAAATAQLAAYVCLAAGLRPEGPLGESLALGLVTDTGGFLHGSTTAAVFRLAALLSDSGCDIHKLREKLDNNWSPARMALWARLMQRVEISCDGRAALALARLEDLRQCGALKEDLEGLVEQFRRLRGVEASGILREDAPGVYKLSLRSTGTTDVRSVAVQFGGGGHRNAAGGTLRMEGEEAFDAVRTALCRMLRS